MFGLHLCISSVNVYSVVIVMLTFDVNQLLGVILLSLTTVSCSWPIIIELGIDVEFIVNITVELRFCTLTTPCAVKCERIVSSSMCARKLCLTKHLPF